MRNSLILPATVSGAYAQLLREWLQSVRSPDEKLLSELELLRPLERVPLTTWEHWLQQAAKTQESSDFALAIGALTDHRHLGLLAHLTRYAPTLKNALDDYLRFEGLQYGATWGRLVDLPESTGLRWYRPDILDPLVEIVGLASFYAYVRKYYSAKNVIEISFTFPRPADTSAYDDYFDCPVEFDQPFLQLKFPQHAMRSRVGQRDEALHERLLAVSAQSLNLSDPANELIQELVHFMQDSLPEGGAVLERFAEQRGVTPRAFQKQLAASGLNFRSLLNSVRQNAAIHFLEDQALTLAEVAFLLGYSEQSAFNHAFVSWFGKTPKSYREKYIFKNN